MPPCGGVAGRGVEAALPPSLPLQEEARHGGGQARPARLREGRGCRVQRRAAPSLPSPTSETGHDGDQAWPTRLREVRGWAGPSTGAWPRPRRPAVASADPAASPVLLPLQRSAQRNGSSSSATARKCFGSGRHGGSREPRRGFTCHGGAALDIWRRKRPSPALCSAAVRCGRDEEQDNRQPATVRHYTAFTTLPAPALERSLPFASPPDHPWAVSISLPCLRNRFLSNINTSFCIHN